MLADQQPPLSHDLGHLQILAGARLPEELLDLQDFAVKARHSPDEQLRAELEARLDAMGPRWRPTTFCISRDNPDSGTSPPLFFEWMQAGSLRELN